MTVKQYDPTFTRRGAVQMVQRLRAYWNKKGFTPEISIEEGELNGQKFYSIRSGDICRYVNLGYT